MNVKLLNKVMAEISAEPRRLEMCVFGELVDPTGDDAPPCGTTACIAGWSMILSGKYKLTAKGFPYDDTQAIEVLGITRQQSASLFYVSDWPNKFLRRYSKAKTPKGRASAAVERIKHFIATGN